VSATECGRRSRKKEEEIYGIAIIHVDIDKSNNKIKGVQKVLGIVYTTMTSSQCWVLISSSFG